MRILVIISSPRRVKSNDCSWVGTACGGALAALFTATNLVTTKLRKVHIGGDKFKQVMEPVVVMVVYTLIAVIIPLMFPCTSTGCILDEATAPEIVALRARASERSRRASEGGFEGEP